MKVSRGNCLLGIADSKQKDVFHEGRQGKSLSFGELLIAAGISGMPAAYLTTPFGKLRVAA